MRLVVYCTAAERRVLRCSGGRLRPEALFAADESGLAAFRHYLQHCAGAIITLVADVAGEEFHEELIPQLRGRDRDAIVRRRLAQRYPDARLATALSLGRAGAELRKERVLLASFANAHQFAPWLDGGAARAGAGRAPRRRAFAPARAATRAAQCILASCARRLRTCFLEQGRLRLPFEALRPRRLTIVRARAQKSYGWRIPGDIALSTMHLLCRCFDCRGRLACLVQCTLGGSALRALRAARSAARRIRFVAARTGR
jgi:hypothetical protein